MLFCTLIPSIGALSKHSTQKDGNFQKLACKLEQSLDIKVTLCPRSMHPKVISRALIRFTKPFKDFVCVQSILFLEYSRILFHLPDANFAYCSSYSWIFPDEHFQDPCATKDSIAAHSIQRCQKNSGVSKTVRK